MKTQAYCCESARLLITRVHREQSDLANIAKKCARYHSQKGYVPARMLADLESKKEALVGMKYTFEQHVKGCARPLKGVDSLS